MRLEGAGKPTYVAARRPRARLDYPTSILPVVVATDGESIPWGKCFKIPKTRLSLPCARGALIMTYWDGAYVRREAIVSRACMEGRQQCTIPPREGAAIRVFTNQVI